MLKILVVEDNAKERDTIVGILQPLGHDVETAENGQDALALLEKNTYALIVTDILMPGSTGFEILETLRVCESKIPVIICSAYLTDGAQDHLKMKLHGCVEIVSKPFKPETLQTAARKLLA